MADHSVENKLQESSPRYGVAVPQDDFAMLQDSLALTPWERILANDDIVNFGDSLHAAMEKRSAESR